MNAESQLLPESTSTITSTTSTSSRLPKEFFDSHHHFIDTENNAFQQAFLGSIVPNEVYLPPDYQRDVVTPLAAAGVTVIGSTHMECMPDDGVAEAHWVESLSNTGGGSTTSTVQAIVASVDLTLAPEKGLQHQLQQLQQIPKVKGIRWILDCVGKYPPPGTESTATHIATTRHDGIDYLRGSQGGYDGTVVPEFERGFALLSSYNFSFDLQCAPVQLPTAAQLLARYPNIPVVINHLGKPRMILGKTNDKDTTMASNGTELVVHQEELQNWRVGMQAMAALPHVFVKISMLGYCIPGWIRHSSRIDLMKGLVRETVSLFTPQRCMVATNFWKNAALSDADGLSDIGPDPVQFLSLLQDFLSDYSEQDRHAIFCGTAQSFYRVVENNTFL